MQDTFARARTRPSARATIGYLLYNSFMLLDHRMLPDEAVVTAKFIVQKPLRTFWRYYLIAHPNQIKGHAGCYTLLALLLRTRSAHSGLPRALACQKGVQRVSTMLARK